MDALDSLGGRSVNTKPPVAAHVEHLRPQTIETVPSACSEVPVLVKAISRESSYPRPGWGISYQIEARIPVSHVHSAALFYYLVNFKAALKRSTLEARVEHLIVPAEAGGLGDF